MAKWITRERPKIDRIACPWLILRFIDAQAEFVYVPAPDVLRLAEETGATPYDVPGVHFSHVGELCSFDAFISSPPSCVEPTPHGWTSRRNRPGCMRSRSGCRTTSRVTTTRCCGTAW
jgi:hypothetical protein